MTASLKSLRQRVLQVLPQRALAMWVVDSLSRRQQTRSSTAPAYKWPRAFLTSYALQHWDRELDTLIQTKIDETKVP